MRVKTADDEREKDSEIQSHIDEILEENMDCINGYDVSVKEEWVRTKRLEVTVFVCFHCIEPETDALIMANLAYEKPKNKYATHYWALFIIGFVVSICVMACCAGLCAKYRKRTQNNTDSDSEDSSPLSMISLPSVRIHRKRPGMIRMSTVSDGEQESVSVTFELNEETMQIIDNATYDI